MPTEGLVIDSTAEDAANVPLDLLAYPFVVTAIRTPTPPLQPRWAEPADADGERLVASRYQNREITVSLEIVPTESTATARAATAEAALAQLAAKVTKVNREGGTLRRTTPSGRTLTFDMLTADGLDPSWDVEWSTAQTLAVDLRFTAKPFWRGVEVAGPSVSGTTPVLTLDVPTVPGDAPAVGRIVLTEGSSQSRRHVEWGLEQRYYTPASPAPLLIDSADLVTSGFAGVQATRTGAYRRSGARFDTVSATLVPQAIAVCGTGDQPHAGTFLVKARVFASSASVQVRINYRDGDGPLSANNYTSPPVAATFAEVELGLIAISPARSGSQRWTGRIEAYSPNAGDTVEIDYLVLIPVTEGYGRARAAYVYAPGVALARDEFSRINAPTTINGRTALIGGVWASSGATGDFTSDFNTYLRTTTSDTGKGRIAILGSAVTTDVEVTASLGAVPNAPQRPPLLIGVIARYVDASNFLRAEITPNMNSVTLAAEISLVVDRVVGGTVTELGRVSLPNRDFNWNVILTAYESGRVIARAVSSLGLLLATIDVTSSFAATGGALASGKAGFFDYSPDPSAGLTRYYRNFTVSTPVPEPIALYPNRTLEVRWDDTIRQDATGTTYGRPQTYEGDRMFLPPAGDEGRVSRLLVKADRNDLAVGEYAPLGDSLTAQIYYTPRGAEIP